MSSEIKLTHPSGPGEVLIRLPMDMWLAADVLMALGELGFIVPDAVGKSTMTIECDLTGGGEHGR